MAFLSSNRNSAKSFGRYVLPVPVGPRKRKEPTGRLGIFNPARDLRTALAMALIALSCPIILPDKKASIWTSRSFSAVSIFESGIPVRRATTAAISASSMTGLRFSTTVLMASSLPVFSSKSFFRSSNGSLSLIIGSLPQLLRDAPRIHPIC